MTDIVKRLRSNKVMLVGDMKAGIFIRDTMLEAATEIERLRAALAEYGDHTYECDMKNVAGQCTCGYEAALSSQQQLDAK